MTNIMEKIKYFSNEMNSKNEIINMTRKTLDETGKKSLIKTYQSLSNSSIPSTMNNKVYQYQNKYRYKNPIILKDNNVLGNYNYNYSNKRNNNTFALYSNKQFYDNKKKNLFSNINYNSAPKMSNINMYDDINYYNKYDNNNTSKSNMNKCISFNYDYFNKNDLNNINENDIQRRNYSSNNFRTNNFIRNDLTNQCSNDDLKYDKIIKNELSFDKLDKYDKYDKLDKDLEIKSIKKLANKKLNLQYITTNNNTSKENDISKDNNNKENNNNNKDNINKSYRNKSANNIKEVKNIKREHCNINISEYYKNINSKETKKKKNTKISSNKRIKNIKNKVNKTDKKNISNGNNHINTSRNQNYYSSYNNSIKTRDDTNRYKNKNNIYTNAVCSTFNPYNNSNLYENEKSSSTQKVLRKSTTNFRENFPGNNMNNLNFQYLVQNQNHTEKNNDYHTYNYNYKYFGFNKSKNYSNYDINNDYNNISKISLNKKNININSNNNYNKDFLDIITNKNNDINKYDHLSIYNNIINQKKENTKLDDDMPINQEKYDNIFSKLKCNNAEECSNKIDILLNYEAFFKKVNLLYNKNSFNKKKNKNNKNLKDIYSWVESTVEKNKKLVQELKKYQKGKLSEEIILKGFDKFNKFNNNNNKKSIFEYGTKKIINENKNCFKGKIKTRNNNINDDNKENSDFNSYFNNIDDYRLKTRTLSYSNLSIDNLKNENEYYINTFSMSEKKSKNFKNIYITN